MQRSRSSGSLLVFAALLAIGLGVGALYRALRAPAGPPAAAALEAPGSAAAPEPAELAALRRRMAQLEARLWIQAQRQAAPEAAPAMQPDAEPEARADAERRQRDHVAAVAAEFRDEASDPGWASSASAAIQAAIAADDALRPLVRGVECRARTCRVALADEGPDGAGKGLPMLVQRLGAELPRVVFDRAEDAGGGSTLILYMSRAIAADAPAAR